MLKRFSISLEKELLDDFDKLIQATGYINRSEAIRDLIRNNLVQKEWLEGETETAGVVVLVYDHHRQELSQKLTDLQHQAHESITAALHVHLDQHNCLEVIVLQGRSGSIQKISDSLISTKGVKHGRFVSTTMGRKFL